MGLLGTSEGTITWEFHRSFFFDYHFLSFRKRSFFSSLTKILMGAALYSRGRLGWTIRTLRRWKMNRGGDVHYTEGIYSEIL